MKFKWMLFFASCFTTTVFSMFIDHTEKDFDSAWNDCVLAAPPIDLGHSGNTVEIKFEEGLEDGESAWVGYTQDYEVFQFIGCITLAILKDVSQVSNSKTIQPDIGQCQTICRSSEYFGLRLQVNGRTSCRCINVTDVSMALESVASCEEFDENSEFHVAKRPNVAVYKTVTRDVNKVLKENAMWTKNDYNCLKLQNPQSNTYHWENCSAYFEVMCVSKTNATSVSLLGSIYHGSWKMAAERCLEENKFLISYRKTIVTEKTAPFWTSNVRAFVVKETTDVLDPHQTYRRYGYIKRLADVYSLQFGQRDMSLKSLCKAPRSPGVASSSTSHNILTSSTESSNDVFVGDTNAETGSNVAVFIVLPLVAILLIVGIISGVLLWRKRKAHTSNTDLKLSIHDYSLSKDSNENSHDQRCNSSYGYNEIGDIDKSTNENYDMIKDDWESEPTRNSVNNHSYCVLEKTETNNLKLSISDDYDYAKEVETKRSSSHNHTFNIFEVSLNLNTTQSHKDKKTGYDYAKVMSKDDGKKAKHGHQINDQSDVAGEDTNYNHIRNGQGARNKKNTQYQDKGQDGDNVYQETTVNITNDTYDHIKKGVQNNKASRGEHGHVNNDMSFTYDKLKEAAYDHDEESYNITNLAQARPATADNPYDHIS